MSGLIPPADVESHIHRARWARRTAFHAGELHLSLDASAIVVCWELLNESPDLHDLAWLIWHERHHRKNGAWRSLLNGARLVASILGEEPRRADELVKWVGRFYQRESNASEHFRTMLDENARIPKNSRTGHILIRNSKRVVDGERNTLKQYGKLYASNHTVNSLAIARTLHDYHRKHKKSIIGRPPRPVTLSERV